MREFFLFNPWISVAAISWFLAQALKMIFHTLVTRKLDFSRLVDTGGMPSSHTALVAGLSTSVGLVNGWNSAPFAIALCFSCIIIYDATNLRRSAGYQAEVLNEIVPQLLHGKVIKDEFTFRRLRELLGHTPFEVFIGALLGILVALWFVHVSGIANSA